MVVNLLNHQFQQQIINIVDDFDSYNYNYSCSYSGMNADYATYDETSCEITTNASTKSQQCGYDGGMINLDLSRDVILDIEFPNCPDDVV